MAKQALNIEAVIKKMQKHYEKEILSIIKFEEQSVNKFIAKDKSRSKTMDGLHKIIANAEA